MGHLWIGINMFQMLIINLINDRINLRIYHINDLTQLILLLSSGIIGIGFILASYFLAVTLI
ncbi:hypothetical protein CDG76_23585 [Nostoc sp. 'Peltigera membranacea cyanobiont' 210A]|nr:hypothetical protein CDG76_23585 [Nostoc sp. 'Peltigera membranacea cyanobiont' 210A]